MLKSLGVAIAAGAFLCACGSSATTLSTTTTVGTLPPTTAPTSTTVPPPTTTTLPPAPPGWTIASMGSRGIAVLTKNVTTSSGSTLTVAEFPAATTAFHLHVGSTDPPGSASISPTDAGPQVSAYEISLLVAAFNGGFKQDATAGGVEIDGTAVSPLLPGKASAVIDADGSLHIGVWGQSAPTPGERVSAVRQNLQLLVDSGRATAASANPSLWGSTVGSNPAVARSALGVDSSGNVFFAGSMAALPSDLAQAMVSVGAVRAMQLDINPFWVTLGIAGLPGGSLVGYVAGENHSPSIFLTGWQRDFFTVLALPPRNCRLVFPAPPEVAAPDPPTVVCGSIGIRPASTR